MSTTPYQLCINNATAFIKSEENKKEVLKGKGFTAFDFSTILSICFCKSKEEIVADIISCRIGDQEQSFTFKLIGYARVGCRIVKAFDLNEAIDKVKVIVDESKMYYDYEFVQ